MPDDLAGKFFCFFRFITTGTLTTAGILLITVAAVVFGGLSLLMNIVKRIPGYLDNPVRRSLWTADHTHAGVLVIFALVALPYLDQTDYSGGMQSLIRTLLVAAPILMPLGFFLSIVKPADTKPNKLIWLVPVGGASSRSALCCCASACSDSRDHRPAARPLHFTELAQRPALGPRGDFGKARSRGADDAGTSR